MKSLILLLFILTLSYLNLDLIFRYVDSGGLIVSILALLSLFLLPAYFKAYKYHTRFNKIVSRLVLDEVEECKKSLLRAMFHNHDEPIYVLDGKRGGRRYSVNFEGSVTGKGYLEWFGRVYIKQWVSYGGEIENQISINPAGFIDMLKGYREHEKPWTDDERFNRAYVVRIWDAEDIELVEYLLDQEIIEMLLRHKSNLVIAGGEVRSLSEDSNPDDIMARFDLLTKVADKIERYIPKEDDGLVLEGDEPI